jgi:hypothetical protein
MQIKTIPRFHFTQPESLSSRKQITINAGENGGGNPLYTVGGKVS